MYLRKLCEEGGDGTGINLTYLDDSEHLTVVTGRVISAGESGGDGYRSGGGARLLSVVGHAN